MGKLSPRESLAQQAVTGYAEGIIPVLSGKGGLPAGSQDGPDSKRAKSYQTGTTRNQLPGGTRLCGAFNSVRGCNGGGSCPRGVHKCNYIISSDGSVCYATDHGACDHECGGGSSSSNRGKGSREGNSKGKGKGRGST